MCFCGAADKSAASRSKAEIL